MSDLELINLKREAMRALYQLAIETGSIAESIECVEFAFADLIADEKDPVKRCKLKFVCDILEFAQTKAKKHGV